MTLIVSRIYMSMPGERALILSTRPFRYIACLSYDDIGDVPRILQSEIFFLDKVRIALHILIE